MTGPAEPLLTEFAVSHRFESRWECWLFLFLHGRWRWSPLPAPTALEWRSSTMSTSVRYGLITKFYFVCFLEENLFFLFACGPNQWPRGRLFPFFPTSNSLSILDPWRAFWTDTAIFKGPQPCLICCFQKCRDKDIFRFAALGAEAVVNTRSKLWLFVRVKHAFHTDPWVQKANRIELS